MSLNAIQQKWVDALRSGKYKQGKYRLRDVEDRFCCLGVLCERAAQEGIIPPHGYHGYDSSSACLPDSVCTWAGVRTLWGSYRGGELSAENDTGKTFLQIAGIIESEPKGLFVTEPA